MQLMIVVAVLLIASTTYLVRQFWTRELLSGTTTEADPVTGIDSDEMPRAA